MEKTNAKNEYIANAKILKAIYETTRLCNGGMLDYSVLCATYDSIFNHVASDKEMKEFIAACNKSSLDELAK